MHKAGLPKAAFATRFACARALAFALVFVLVAPVCAQQSSPSGVASPTSPAPVPVTDEVRSRGVIILRAEPRPAEISPSPPIVPATAPNTAPDEPAVLSQPIPPPVTQPARLPEPLLVSKPAPIPDPLPAQPSPLPAAQAAPVSAAQLPLPLQQCPRPFERSTLQLSVAAQQGGSEARDFNRSLRRKLLARRGPVVVDLAQPYGADKLPPAALAAWLGRVKSSGGTVSTVQYCEQSRGLFSMFRRPFSSESSADYAAADRYNALQYNNGLDQLITQIEFRLREAAK